MKKAIKYDQAYKLMDRKDAQGKPIPFHLVWKTVDGRVVENDVMKVVSYDKPKGCRKIILPNGEMRMIYDVLIRQVDDTLVVVS